MSVCAVITADIVASTHLSKALLETLLKKLRETLTPYPHEFYRGDSFQVLVQDPQDAFDVLLKLRIDAMKLLPEETSPPNDIRASIAIGPVQLPVEKIGTATDEAFVLSGRAFEQLKSPQRLLITAVNANKTVDAAFRLLANFTDFIFERMTAKQAEVVYELLHQKTQTEAAAALKKAQATVHKHAQAAGWPALEKLIGDYKLLSGSLIL